MRSLHKECDRVILLAIADSAFSMLSKLQIADRQIDRCSPVLPTPTVPGLLSEKVSVQTQPSASNSIAAAVF